MTTAIDYAKQTFQAARRRVQHKTAAYTVLLSDAGTLFTNKGASGSVTFTLPTPSVTFDGVEVEFMVGVAQTLVISCATADLIITYGDAAADSVTLAAVIGNGATAICDGTNWLIRQHVAYNGTTHAGLSVTT